MGRLRLLKVWRGRANVPDDPQYEFFLLFGD